MQRITILAATFCILSTSAFAQKGTFEGLGFLGGIEIPVPPYLMLVSEPYHISADGSVVVGYTTSENGYEAFRWENGVMTGLGSLADGFSFHSEARGVSPDGSVVVGYTGSEVSPGGWEAFIWTQDDGMVGLGHVNETYTASEGWGVTNDGTVVSGRSYMGGEQAFRWTPEDGMVGLGSLSPHLNSSEGFGMSADGSVIVGTTVTEIQQVAFRWTEDEGMVSLGAPEGGSAVAYRTSADGSVIVGSLWDPEIGFEAFRWTETEGMVGLGSLPGGGWSSEANAVSDDGSVIVGISHSADGFQAFIWTEDKGMRGLKEVLESEYELDLAGWTLRTAIGVSADGTVIIGTGMNPDDHSEAWRVDLGSSGEPGPENDHIADAIEIPVANATYEGSNVNATLEDGEPEPSCTFSDWTTNYSIWWTFTADTESNRVTIDTFGSDFDTILSLHWVDDLSEVACDDDTDGLQSQIEDASIVAGETYLIRVAGYDQSSSNQGEIQLTTAFHWVSGEDGPNEIVQGITHPSPNPVREMASFTLTVDRGQQVTVEVFDMMGRRVQALYEGSLNAGATETLRLNANALSSGVYVIRALGEDFVDTQRITVVR